jgi:hypothetical protein
MHENNGNELRTNGFAEKGLMAARSIFDGPVLESKCFAYADYRVVFRKPILWCPMDLLRNCAAQIAKELQNHKEYS